MSIEVLTPGLLTSIQDAGRQGFAAIGLSAGGAMDKTSLAIANFLVGNQATEAGLEITLAGPTLKFHQPSSVALVGGEVEVILNGSPVSLFERITIPSQGVLEIGRIKTGARVYLAVTGGFKIDNRLGSKSTHLLASFGGHKGRALQKGDVIFVDHKSAATPNRNADRVSKLPPVGFGSHLQLRVVKGPEHHLFAAESWQEFLSSDYSVSAQSNRMGIRLCGDITLTSPMAPMTSSGLYAGNIQIPPNGKPIIATAECQTIGGYPRIAHVIACDLDLTGQLPPGSKVSFVEVSLAQSAKLLQQKQERLHNYLR